MSETTEEIVKEEQGLALYEAKALERVNPLRQKLIELKETYKDFPDLSTTAGKELAKKHIKAFRDFKGEVEEKRVSVVRKVNELVGELNVEFKSVWSDAEKEQLDRDKKLKDFLAEDKRIKDEKREAEEKQILEREREIFALGGKYNKEDDTFSLATVENIKRETIKTASAELYQNEILRLFKEAADKIEADRQETERLRQEAEEKQQEEARLLKLEQGKLREEQAELLQQRYEIRMDRLRAIGLEGQPTVNVKDISNDEFRTYYDKVAEEIAAAKQAEADKKERERKAEELQKAAEAWKAKTELRYDQLTNLGMTWNFNTGAYVFADVNVDNSTEICLLDDAAWDELVDKITPVIADRKAEAERVRLEELEKQRIANEQEALKKSRLATLKALNCAAMDSHLDFGTLPENEWSIILAAAQKAYDDAKHQEWLAEQKRLADIEEAKRIAKIEEGKDKEKWKDVVDYLKKTPLHDMRSNQYRSKMKTVRDFLSDLN